MKMKWIKNVKKILAFSFVLVMIMSTNVFAAVPIEFHVENQGGKAGDVLTVPVEFTTGEEVGGFELVIYYDNEIMKFQKLKKGDLIKEGDGLFDYNAEYGAGAIKLVYVVADTVKAEGVIAEISFKLKKDCKEGLPIGVGIDKVLDGSEESNDISEEATVTGADEAFQETVAQKAEEVKEQREAKRKEKEKEEEQAGNEKSEEGSSDDTGKTEDSKEKNSKLENDKADKTDEKSGIGGMIGITFSVVIAVIGVFVVWRKKQK